MVCGGTTKRQIQRVVIFLNHLDRLMNSNSLDGYCSLSNVVVIFKVFMILVYSVSLNDSFKICPSCTGDNSF
jgi:hypothetical protein